MKESFVIGIAGGSGSGKSTLSERIKNAFPNQVALIRCDDYYISQNEIPLKERKNLNYDTPQALELDLMLEHVKALKARHDINAPLYDFVSHSRCKETQHIEARPIVLIDGILIFTSQKLRSLMDLKIYVDVAADERILRRAVRDVTTRGRSLDDVVNQYLTTVKPMHDKYVEPTKAYADLIVSGGKNEIVLEVIKAKIEKTLCETEK